MLTFRRFGITSTVINVCVYEAFQTMHKYTMRAHTHTHANDTHPKYCEHNYTDNKNNEVNEDQNSRMSFTNIAIEIRLLKKNYSERFIKHRHKTERMAHS